MMERFQVGKRVVWDRDGERCTEGTITALTHLDGEVSAVIVVWDDDDAPGATQSAAPVRLSLDQFDPSRGLYLKDEWEAAHDVVVERLLREWEAHQRGDEGAILRAARYLAAVSRGQYSEESERY